MFERTIEETDINSSIETIDKIAGGRAVHDNTAGAIVADRDKIAEVAEFLAEQPIEATLDNTVDPYIELAVPEVVDRIGEEAIEIIIIDSTTETIIDKTAEEIAEFLVEQPTEAIIDNTIDLSIELAVLEAAELVVDTSNEAILVAEERVDEFSVDPLIAAIQPLNDRQRS